MKRVLTVIGVIVLLLAGAGLWVTRAPVPQIYDDDGGTAWLPTGTPVVPRSGLPLNTPDTFHTMHVGVNNTDHLWIATAPQQEIAWSVEPDLYVPEGPTIDDAGRVYFSPLYPQENVSLVVLDGANGERLWTLPHDGDSKGAGAPLILTQPDGSGQQVIYHATYHKAWAVEPSGKVLWQRPTGLKYKQDGVPPHAWGMNYVPQQDALISVTQDGKVIALDRMTGKRLLGAFDLPGEPASARVRDMPGQKILDRGNELARKRFGDIPAGDGLFSEMVRVIYGANSEVSNYYAVDPNTGRLFIAATAPDEVDGTIDKVSDYGALYALDLRKVNDRLRFRIAARFDFKGGTGSTPTVSNDGKRVYVSDENGNVLALDRNLKTLWEFNVGNQVAASIAVSADNAELYAVTRNDIFKLWDRGDRAELAWTATLDAFPKHTNINALTPTITANGLAISIGASRDFDNTSLLLEAGYGLLDRETGRVRGFVMSPEESIAVTVVDQDGGFTIAHSPVRRLGSAAVFGFRVPDIRGGITKFRSSNDAVLAREAMCAAAAIDQRRESLGKARASVRKWDRAQVRVLRAQAVRAMRREKIKFDYKQPAHALCKQLQSS